MEGYYLFPPNLTLESSTVGQATKLMGDNYFIVAKKLHI